MNKKILAPIVFYMLFFVSCNAKNFEPNLSLILPTESNFMTLLDFESKEKIIEKCNTELKKVEKKDVFVIKDLKKYFTYEEKIGKDEFIWFISPVLDKDALLPKHQIILLKKENGIYKLLTKYYSKIIWGERHLYLQFNNCLIIKGNDSAKGFIYFDNRTEIKFKTANENDGYTINQCKGQYVGSSNGNYFRFKDEPLDYKLIEEFAFYPDEEWKSIHVEASEFLWDEKTPLKYALCNAFDGNLETSYVENTEDDLFHMYISFPGLSKKLALINGFCKNSDLYRKNNRIKEVASEFTNDSEISTELTDMNDRFRIEDNNLKFQILNYVSNGYVFISQIYPGTNYNDTCLAEINFYTDEAKWLFGEIDE